MSHTDNPLEIIDISQATKETAEKLLHAASTQGFLLLEGHGFSQQEVDDLFNLSKAFFDLPYENKSKFAIDESNRGYTGIGVENLEEDRLNEPIGDPKEAFNFAKLNLLTGEADQSIPPIFQENHQIIKSAIIKLRNVLLQTLELLATALEIPLENGGSQWFTQRHTPGKANGSAFRFLHYPSPIKPGMSEDDIKKASQINVAGAHTDYGGITLLFQRKDEDGLEILSPSTKQWTPVPYVEASPKFSKLDQAPPLVVNIADQLCYWTNGLLKSTLHRVRFPSKLLQEGRPRYSIVLFAHPDDETLLEPIPSKKVELISGKGASYYLAKHGKSQSALEHLQKRLASTYGWKY